MCACIMEIFYKMCGLKIANQKVSDMDAMTSCIFNLCDVRMRIAIPCIVPRGYLRGPPEKKKSVSGGIVLSGGSW